MRHPIAGILGDEERVEIAFFRLAGNENGIAVVLFARKKLKRVDAIPALLLSRAVADLASLQQNGRDFFPEAHGLFRGSKIAGENNGDSRQQASGKRMEERSHRGALGTRSDQGDQGAQGGEVTG